MAVPPFSPQPRFLPASDAELTTYTPHSLVLLGLSLYPTKECEKCLKLELSLLLFPFLILPELFHHPYQGISEQLPFIQLILQLIYLFCILLLRLLSKLQRPGQGFPGSWLLKRLSQSGCPPTSSPSHPRTHMSAHFRNVFAAAATPPPLSSASDGPAWPSSSRRRSGVSKAVSVPQPTKPPACISVSLQWPQHFRVGLDRPGAIVLPIWLQTVFTFLPILSYC